MSGPASCSAGLLGDVVEGLAPQPGRPKSTMPTANRAPVACWPPSSRSPAGVSTKYAGSEYPLFMQPLAVDSPHAEKICLVQDHLNPHLLSTFYDCLPAAMARKLAERFEVSYTPKAASWLNRSELDFSALARQCLKRRIPTQAQLAYQVYCWSRQRQQQKVKKRQQQEVKIRWQFTPEQARQTRNSHYCKVNKANKQYTRIS